MKKVFTQYLISKMEEVLNIEKLANGVYLFDGRKPLYTFKPLIVDEKIILSMDSILKPCAGRVRLNPLKYYSHLALFIDKLYAFNNAYFSTYIIDDTNKKRKYFGQILVRFSDKTTEEVFITKYSYKSQNEAILKVILLVLSDYDEASDI